MDIEFPRARLFEDITARIRPLAMAIACVVFAGAWFGIGGRTLLNPDEGRYAEIPREMLVNHDWVTPRLNDLKYIEKPPLQYWATAVAYKALGVNAFASRLWCSITGLASIALAGWMGTRLFNRGVGLLAAILLAGSWMQGIFGRLNTLDMGLSLFLNASLGAFLFAQKADTGSQAERNWMLGAWTMAAFAFLSKGLVAVVLPGLTLVLYSSIVRDFSMWRRLHLLPGSAVFVVIVAPWIVEVSTANSEFLRFFFFQEHFQRFLEQGHARVQPWWFFLPIALAGALPWVTLVVPALWSAVRQRLARHAHSRINASLFLAIWVLVVIVFFSFSQSKLPPYILPIMPALALVSAKYATERPSRTLVLHIGGAALLYGAVLATTFLVTPPQNEHITLNESVRILDIAKLSFGLALFGSICGLWFAYRKHATASWIAVCAGSFVCVSALLLAADSVGEFRSGYDLAAIVGRFADHHRSIYSVQKYDQSLTFYIRRPVKLVEYRGELDFGLRQEPAKWIPNEAAFLSAWKSEASGAIALLPRSFFSRLNAENFSMSAIGGNESTIVVIKPDSKSE